jgi:modification methylase
MDDSSVELMVTSPPYPMIEMWDDIFSLQNSIIKNALQQKDGNNAFELMHQELDKVWAEVYRVLKEGGFACINIGDATRKIDADFKLYPSHSRILQSCLNLGFVAFPEILWRKQTNAPNKFMGSGMLPAGAYVTLEHEFILVLRKGSKREFKTAKEKRKRMQSAFFWEERNLWFSDIWEDLKGTKQNNISTKIRERSGAYPFELPFRIINMFSIKGDTVLDPFLGTGTTIAAAIATGRNSIGIEIDPNFKEQLLQRFVDMAEFSKELLDSRLENHVRLAQKKAEIKEPFSHINKAYGFPVMTKQEVEIIFDEVTKIGVKGDLVEVQYIEKQNSSAIKEGKNEN